MSETMSRIEIDGLDDNKYYSPTIKGIDIKTIYACLQRDAQKYFFECKKDLSNILISLANHLISSCGEEEVVVSMIKDGQLKEDSQKMIIRCYKTEESIDT